MVYLGEVAGSIIAIPIYKKIPIKVILLVCIAGQAITSIGFACSYGIYELMETSRFFAGIFQVFISIFAPVWCVTHAPEDKRTSWITSLMVATPGGIVAGYLISALILACKAPWAISFYLQVVLLVPVAIYIGFINKSLLDLDMK